MFKWLFGEKRRGSDQCSSGGEVVHRTKLSFDLARELLRLEGRVFEVHPDQSGSIWWEDVALLPVFPQGCVSHICFITDSSFAGYMVEFPTARAFSEFVLAEKEDGLYYQSL